jgi:hypothetical protein
MSGDYHNNNYHDQQFNIEELIHQNANKGIHLIHYVLYVQIS